MPIGYIYLDEKNWQEAKQQLEASLKAWRELGNSYWVILTAIALIEYELAGENWIEAGRRLAQVEQLIAKSGKNARSPAWVSLLEKFHRILAENKKPL